MTNKLFYGDNLDILRNREYFPDACVDLIYLDPPFNSNRNYNVLFRDESGVDSEAQILAFKDTWHWGPAAESSYREMAINAPERVSTTINALLTIIGRNQMMAYLVMMTARLVQLHRVLKPTGSLYLHCDPTASHYLKIIIDTIFGFENFRNEIIWKRTSAHSDAKRYARVHDVIFFYTKSEDAVWYVNHQEHNEAYIKSHYNKVNDNGRRFRTDNLTAYGLTGGGYTYEWNGVTKLWRVPQERMQELHDEGRIRYTRNGTAEYIRYLDEMEGQVLDTVWTDIAPINARAKERLGYPTQKPLALLERIIQASSNPGDVVLDPFCGCGTATVAAQKLGRSWMGIDITHLSVALQKYRLQDMFDLKPNVDYQVIGEPTTLSDARQLAQDNRYQFQWWALSLVRAKPLGGEEGSSRGKKGKDRGIDGVINFFDGTDKSPKLHRVLVQVKSGKVKSGDVRDLVGTVQREEAAIGVFITLEEPSRDMITEALSAGTYQSPVYGTTHPRIQILSIEGLLEGKDINMPPQHGTFKQAERYKGEMPYQPELFD